MARIKIGWAQTSITPDRPTYNGGQIYPRVSKYVHDEVTATALALDNGESQALLLSMDIMCPPDTAVTERVRANLARLEGFKPECLCVFATHTHNSIAREPFLFSPEATELLGVERLGLPELPADILAGEEFDDFLVERMTSVAERAWLSRQNGAVSSASDYAVVAFNRRLVFESEGRGETLMYGVASRDDFARYEAGSDHSVDMIYTWSEDGRLTGALVCVPCPSQVFELHSFTTADYWHYTREAIREKLGGIYVLPVCGAAGDQNPLDLTRISKFNKNELEAWGAQAGEVMRNIDMADECRGIAERITEAVARGLRASRARIESAPEFGHLTRELRMPIRKVSEDDYKAALAAVKAARERFSKENPLRGADLVRIFEPMGVVTRWIIQNRAEYARVPVHYMRIGKAALATSPFELFIEYSLRIKARAASPQTIVAQLTDLYMDYLPTRAAVEGGSYSSAPASTTCGPDSGGALVEDALAAITELWRR